MTLKKTQAWKNLSKYIRQRDRKCFTCGAEATEAGHFIHRNAATFFNEWNVHGQCYRCNRFLHGNLGEYALRLEDKIGRKAIEELKKESQGIKRWSGKELKEIEKKYMSEIQINEKESKPKSRPQCKDHKLKFCTLCYPVKKGKAKRIV